MCVFVHTYVCARVCVRECTPKGVMLHVRHTHKQTHTHTCERCMRGRKRRNAYACPLARERCLAGREGGVRGRL